jgi:aryl-alcohol dehydrogenase-like predicted oxidoreductase
MAESIWGKFASKKRDSVYICTKVGMRPADTSAAMRLLKPMARISVAAFPGLQRQVSRVRPKPFKVPLSAELIRTSVEGSRVVQDGKARAISIAGNLEAGIRGLDEALPYRLVQIANNPLEPNLEKLKEYARRRTLVTYGTFSSLDPLVARIDAQKEILSGLHEVGYRGNPTEIAAAFLVDYAFATNSAGVTLFSMFQKEHLDFNLLRLKSHPTLEQLNFIAAALSKWQ